MQSCNDMKSKIPFSTFKITLGLLLVFLIAGTAFANSSNDPQPSSGAEELIYSQSIYSSEEATKAITVTSSLSEEERYGNITYSDRTRPIRMFRPITSDAQHKVSVSFKAPKSGVLSQALLFWIYKSPHYAQGDGGQYIFELRSDDGTSDHAPGEEVLSHVGPIDFPLRDTWAWWPISFPVYLEEGKWYHIIFCNVHPSPENNYASYEYLSHEEDNVPQGLDWVIWTQKYDDSSPWVRNDEVSGEVYGGNEASIILRWEDDTFWGQGYISAMADPPRPRIFGNTLAAEYFIADQDRIVDRISIRLSRIGNPKDRLYVRLEDENGQTIFENTLAEASELPIFDPYDGKTKPFITLNLEPSVQLKKDTAYRLILASPDSESEENSFVLGCPVYSSTNVSTNLSIPSEILTWQGNNRGYLITSVNGGNSWTADPNADMSFYFSSELPSYPAEDINQDGNVNVLDLQICANVFIGAETDPVLVQRADVNGDEVVDVFDVQQIAQKILGE
jgi:hypothetical protein